MPEDRLLVSGLSAEPHAVLIERDRIAAMGADAAADAAVSVIDGAGLTAVPGFIELQVNGVGELDFTSSPASIARAGADLVPQGITSFLPTIVSAPRGTVESALQAVKTHAEQGAVPIGVHAEGPFLSPARHGAHDPAQLREPDLDELRRWIDGGVRLITLAPELPGALDAIRLVAETGAVAAVGHTDADAATTQRAVDAGARYATHLLNAMPPLDRRAPGAAGALLVDERVIVGVIADGHHVDHMVLAIVGRVASGRLSLVSDGVGVHLGGRALAHGDAAQLADGTLAGGTVGLDQGVRTMAGILGREAAIAAVTSTPARLLGLDDGRGELRVGGRADLVLLDDDLRVRTTIVGGRVAFRS